MCSPQKDFCVNQKIHSKCNGLLNTVEGNSDILSNAELPQYIAEEQMYFYDTRKNPPVKPYNDANSDSVSVNESSDNDDHYIPLSG